MRLYTHGRLWAAAVILLQENQCVLLVRAEHSPLPPQDLYHRLSRLWMSEGAKKKPRQEAWRGFFSCPGRMLAAKHAGATTSLDLGFLVRHVLAHDRIVLLHFHLVGMQALVLRGHVEMAGAGGRQQFHFLAHGLDLLAFGTQTRDHG